MKPALLALCFLLLFAFPLAFSEDAQPVLDSNNNPLVPGKEYYIMPPFWGAPGGGVWAGKTGNSECPVTILQSFTDIFRGTPVKFSISGGESTSEILEGTSVEIEFTEKPDCAESAKWEVFIDSDIQKAYVGIGGPENHPGQQPLNGTFKIQISSTGTYKFYKLVFCATGLPTCFDIGRYANPAEGGRRLVLTDEWPFDVIFIEAASYSRIRSVV